MQLGGLNRGWKGAASKQKTMCLQGAIDSFGNEDFHHFRITLGIELSCGTGRIREISKEIRQRTQ